MRRPEKYFASLSSKGRRPGYGLLSLLSLVIVCYFAGVARRVPDNLRPRPITPRTNCISIGSGIMVMALGIGFRRQLKIKSIAWKFDTYSFQKLINFMQIIFRFRVYVQVTSWSVVQKPVFWVFLWFCYIDSSIRNIWGQQVGPD